MTSGRTVPRCHLRIWFAPLVALTRHPLLNPSLPTPLVPMMTRPGLHGAHEAKPRSWRQRPILPGLSPGRPQWVRRVHRFSVSSALHVASSASGSPRLHDSSGSSYPAKPDAGSFQLPVGLPTTCGALASYSTRPQGLSCSFSPL